MESHATLGLNCKPLLTVTLINTNEILHLAAAPPGLTSDTKTPFSLVSWLSFINICTPSPRLSFKICIFFTLFFCNKISSIQHSYRIVKKCMAWKQYNKLSKIKTFVVLHNNFISLSDMIKEIWNSFRLVDVPNFSVILLKSLNICIQCIPYFRQQNMSLL